jgi:predicted dienelactone hydrolase
VPGDPPAQAALYYPTDAWPTEVPMGVFTPCVALDGRLPDKVSGLIVVSHGVGGSEYSHHDLATHLANEGYLVAAVQHPGDNSRDISLLASAAYFSERPKVLSRVIDYLLADPTWRSRIPKDRIGAIGHSAGATSVLALLGGVTDPRRLITHCEEVHDDPVVCTLAQRAIASADPAAVLTPGEFELTDRRIRCAVVMAPMSVVFTPASLAQIETPLKIYTAQHDKVFNSKYHGEHLRAVVRDAEFEEVHAAGHFGFMAQPDRSIASVIGDVADNPAGFDRAAFHARLAGEATQFFRRNFDAELIPISVAARPLPRTASGRGDRR